MQRIEPIVGGAVAGGLTFLILSLTVGQRAAEPATAEAAAVAGAQLPSADATPATSAARVDVEPLLTRISELEVRLGMLENQREALRAPATDADVLAALDSAGTPVEQRDFVLQVLEEQRLAEELERDEERRERELARAEDRADRVAEALSLTGGERDELARVYGEEGVRRADLINEIRDLDPADRDTRDEMRAGFEELREWTDEQLELALGAELAEQVDTWESEQRGGRFGGFGGGGGGGGGRGRGRD